MKLEIIGVYPVPEAEEPCHLLEWEVSDHVGPFDVSWIDQPDHDQPEEDGQAPYAEYLLSPDGTDGEEPLGPFEVAGKARFCFFLHHLQFEVPLQTPTGPIAVPQVRERPRRLDFVEYSAP